MSGAAFHTGKSRQDYRTPPEFLAAFRRRFGETVVDLAASEDNAVADLYFDEATDSLSQDWAPLVRELGPRQWLWLNPPYAKIGAWAAQCAEAVERARDEHITLDRGIAFLVPASVGSKWWADCVHSRAGVYFLRPRLSFDGIGPFPKDLALVFYTTAVGNDFFFDVDAGGYSLWNWKDPS